MRIGNEKLIHKLEIQMKKFYQVIFIVMVFGIQGMQPSVAFWWFSKTTVQSVVKLGKIEGALPNTKIIKFASMIKQRGDLKKVKNIIANLKLSNSVLEDTFMRIAMAKNKLDKVEADKMFTNLRGVPGFRHNLSVICGVSREATKGALHELRIAYKAKEHGFTVVSLR